MLKVMGLCNLHASSHLGPLTASRPLASTSFLGRYALMDFALSNFANSGIDKVGILINNHPRSIIKHLGSANVFNTNTKLGFQQIMYNEKFATSDVYNHDLNNIKANDWLILEAKPDIFVIAPPDILYAIDFRPLIKIHVENKESITVLYTSITNGKSHFIDQDLVKIDKNRLVSLEKNKGVLDTVDVSLDTYIISKEMMQHILTKSNDISAAFSLKDMIQHLMEEGHHFALAEHQGYSRAFFGLDSYYNFSMEFLNYQHRVSLFKEEWPIYTVSHNTAPARYGSKAVVQNSIISNGAQVKGTVINSIISRNVYIAEGAVVKNSIVFTDSKILNNVRIDRLIVDKYVQIERATSLEGHQGILYIKQGERL
jgi:glucose-1-phosphate adenylyltransferase